MTRRTSGLELLTWPLALCAVLAGSGAHAQAPPPPAFVDIVDLVVLDDPSGCLIENSDVSLNGCNRKSIVVDATNDEFTFPGDNPSLVPDCRPYAGAVYYRNSAIYHGGGNGPLGIDLSLSATPLTDPYRVDYTVVGSSDTQLSCCMVDNGDGSFGWARTDGSCPSDCGSGCFNRWVLRLRHGRH